MESLLVKFLLYFYSSQFRVFTVFLFLKLHNKNAKIGALEDLEVKISFTAQPLSGSSQKYKSAPWQVWTYYFYMRISYSILRLRWFSLFVTLLNGFQGVLRGAYIRLWKSRINYCVQSFISLTF